MSASPALSDSPSQIQSAMANGVHRKYVIGKSALRGAQYASLAASPLYLAYAWRKQSFSLRGLARANWLVPLTGGALVGAYAAQMSSGASDQATYAQAQSMRLDAAEVKAEDTFVVSAVLGSLLLPAIFRMFCMLLSWMPISCAHVRFPDLTLSCLVRSQTCRPCQWPPGWGRHGWRHRTCIQLGR